MRIGFTVGCFDLFHVGHQNILRRAAGDCDLLFVGLVTDWLVKMQKGTLPCQAYDERARAVLGFCSDLGLAEARIVRVDDLKLPWMTEVADVAYVGEDQVHRFYEHPDNRFRETCVIERTPGVSSTMLREAMAGLQ